MDNSIGTRASTLVSSSRVLQLPFAVLSRFASSCLAWSCLLLFFVNFARLGLILFSAGQYRLRRLLKKFWVTLVLPPIESQLFPRTPTIIGACMAPELDALCLK